MLGDFNDNPKTGTLDPLLKRTDLQDITSHPTFKSDGGRTVFGGGGIRPDVVVPDDTITTAEKNFLLAISANPRPGLQSGTLNALALAPRFMSFQIPSRKKRSPSNSVTAM